MWFYAKYMKPLLEKCMGFNSWRGEKYFIARRLSLFFTREHHIHTHNAKDSKGNWWKPFLFHHKELGHPLIIVNHAINLSVAQMNTALEMRQSLLACYVSLTQFILLFTQDHSYVKLCKGVSLSFTLSLSLSLSHTHSHAHTLSLSERLTHTHKQTHSHAPNLKVTEG